MLQCKYCKETFERRYLAGRAPTACYKPECRKAWRNEMLKSAGLKFRYGITLAERDAMLAKQGGCGICRRTDPGERDWCVDHDHQTGRVRGILCHWCNTGIGLLKDDPNLLRQALDYLTR